MRTRIVHPFWAYLATVTLIVVAITSIAIAPYVATPTPGHITGVLFGPGMSSRGELDAVIRADDSVQILDVRLDGRLVFVIYHHPEFPERIASLGALHTFDATVAGCHGGSPVPAPPNPYSNEAKARTSS